MENRGFLVCRKLTEVLKTLPSWQPPRSIYVILACGSHAPVSAVQNAAYNVQELMPGSMQVSLEAREFT